MTVPIPLVLMARIRLSQKLMLCALFSSGIFVMVAAFLRAYYSVKNISTLSIALGWASREALVSVITVSSPGIKPLITQSRWFRTYGDGYSSYPTNSNSRGLHYDRSGFSSTSKAQRDGDVTTISTACERQHPYELSSSLGWKKGRRDSSTESQERIIGDDHGPLHGGKRTSKADNAGIVVTTDVAFSEETAHRGLGP